MGKQIRVGWLRKLPEIKKDILSTSVATEVKTTFR